jgi:hypothetical protein
MSFSLLPPLEGEGNVMNQGDYIEVTSSVSSHYAKESLFRGCS